MKRTNKKGFTIVELVIVIAVIAILAAVLIPTFSSLVAKANESKAMQQAKNAYEAWLVDNVDKTPAANLCIKSGDYYFHVTDGQFDPIPATGTHTAPHASAAEKSYKFMKVDTDGSLKEEETRSAAAVL